MVTFITKLASGTVVKSANHFSQKFINMTTFEHVAALAMSGVTFLIGDFNNAMKLLIALQVVDVFTGLKKGKKSKNLSSGKLKEGAASKFGGWLYVIVGHGIDSMLGLTGIGVARTFVLSYLTLMELMSISENAESLSGLKAPNLITQYLAVAKNTMDNAELSKDGKVVKKSKEDE